VVAIRSATLADAPAISALQRAAWFAAYGGIIDPAVIDRVTTPDDGARIRQTFRTRPVQRMIVADADAAQDGLAAAGVVGYACYGPELDVLDAPWPHPVTKAGAAGDVAELYALYVHPDWWSTGTGRALMSRVLARVTQAGYAEAMLWVLEKNARARRFYELAGFAADGAVNALAALGDDVDEVRYRRRLKIE
jgi:GNAT superfamily N-acetyltransferase